LEGIHKKPTTKQIKKTPAKFIQAKKALPVVSKIFQAEQLKSALQSAKLFTLPYTPIYTPLYCA
jgi:hypothetical protein